MALPELEDLPYFPKELRIHQMEYIGNLTHILGLCRPLIPLLSHKYSCIDLGSGSTIPMARLDIPDTDWLFTDLYPIYEHVMTLDVLSDQLPDGAAYTMINAFHHFDNEQQKLIIKKLTDTNKPFYIVELLQPNITTMLKVIVAGLIGVFVLTPIFRPISLSKILLTYLLPIVPLTVLVDGVISVFKSKNVKQYRQLTASFHNVSAYTVNAGFSNKIILITNVTAISQ